MNLSSLATGGVASDLAIDDVSSTVKATTVISGNGISAKRRAGSVREPTGTPIAPVGSPDVGNEALIQGVASTLATNHGCHAVLVYGSRARGDHTAASDLDIMGVRKGGAEYRWAAVIEGVYVDAFVFPEASLRSVGEHHVYMSDAVVVLDHSGFGRTFAARLRAAARRAPPNLSVQEREVRVLWLRKMLARARLDDVEAHYRRAGLHEALLPDYFALRNLRYPGPKRALQWLALNDTTALGLFKRGLEEPASLTRLERLISYVTEPKTISSHAMRSSAPRRQARSSSARA